jgi:hypothetical protein
VDRTPVDRPRSVVDWLCAVRGSQSITVVRKGVTHDCHDIV